MIVLFLESPRCVAIAHIILSTKQNNSPMTSKLKTLLQDQYGYEATTFMPNDPDFNIVEKLQGMFEWLLKNLGPLIL